MLNCQVDFLLIGGYAVNYHGYIRNTGDMDVWLKPNNDNKLKIIKALENTGIHKEDLNKIRDEFDFENVVVFHFGNAPERIDFLTKVQGVKFEEAYTRKAILKIKNFEVPILHLDDLIVSKLLANRPQDKADLDMLQKIHQLDNVSNSRSFWSKLKSLFE